MKRMKVKIYFSEEDLEDMKESFYKEQGLWNTWTYTNKKGKITEVELHLGSEDDDKISEKPLLITEDGVDVFEGDKIAWVINAKYQYCIPFSKSHVNLIKRKPGVYKAFSTVEKAKEYVLMDKPCLSINDVMSAGYGICSPEPLIKIINGKNSNN